MTGRSAPATPRSRRRRTCRSTAGRSWDAAPSCTPTSWARRVGPLDPAAAVLAELALAERAAGRPLLPPVPLYLRRPDAVVPGPPKPVRS